jgi:WD40 repeat protein
MTAQLPWRQNHRVVAWAMMAAGALFVVVMGSVFFRSCYQGLSFYNRRGVIHTAAFDPAGRWLALGGRDVGTGAYRSHGDVQLCESRTGKVLHRLALPNEIWGATFDASGSLLAVYGPGTTVVGSLSVFAVPQNGMPVKVHEAPLAFLPQGTFGFAGRYLVCAGDGQAVVWRVVDWTTAATFRLSGTQVTLDACAETVAWVQGPAAGGGVLWSNIPSSQTRLLAEAEAPLIFLPGGQLVARLRTGSSGLAIWTDFASDKYRPLPDSAGRWIGCSASPDGRHLAAWAADGAVGVWKVGPGEASLVTRLSVPRILRAQFVADGDILAMSIEQRVTIRQNRDGSSQATGVFPGGVELWSVAQAKCIRRFDDWDMVFDGHLLATYVGGGEQVSVWDITNPVKVNLLWEARWRNRSRSLIPLPE